MTYPRIRDLRDDRDWTQQQVADMINVNRRTYSTYETGTHNMTPDVLIQLANLYGVSVDYLLGLTNQPKPYERA